MRSLEYALVALVVAALRVWTFTVLAGAIAHSFAATSAQLEGRK